MELSKRKLEIEEEHRAQRARTEDILVQNDVAKTAEMKNVVEVLRTVAQTLNSPDPSPAGNMFATPHADNVRIIALEAGQQKLGGMVEELGSKMDQILAVLANKL